MALDEAVGGNFGTIRQIVLSSSLSMILKQFRNQQEADYFSYNNTQSGMDSTLGSARMVRTSQASRYLIIYWAFLR